MPPQPRTLSEWKKLEREFTREWNEAVLEREGPRARKRYFGTPDMPLEACGVFGDEAVLGGYLDWLFTDYRPTVRSKTVLERRLKNDRLSPAERVLHESRRDAKLSVYRVVRQVPDEGLEVECAFTNERYFVTDRTLSQEDFEGYWLPLRLFPIRDWFFPAPAGPPVSGTAAHWVLEELDHALEVDGPDALRQHPEILGHMVNPLTELATQPPTLQNTDGDPLELINALFSVSNAAQLLKALDERPDIETEEPGSEWTWFAERTQDEYVCLAHLELIGDQLLVDVNSRRRLGLAMAWLARIPGVEFVRENVRSLDPADLAPDDQSPTELPTLPPELLAPLVETLRHRILGWLDEEIPALDGLTPRQSCQTASGRRRALRLLETMPEPMTQPELRALLDFESLRARLRRELEDA